MPQGIIENTGTWLDNFTHGTFGLPVNLMNQADAIVIYLHSGIPQYDKKSIHYHSYQGFSVKYPRRIN